MFGTISKFITPTNILMAGKTFLDYGKNKKGVGTAQSIANINTRREKEFYEFNKQNLQEAYDVTFQSYMGKYVEDRMNIADQYSNAQSTLNMVASQMGYSLADSSYTNDIEDQLNREYTNELQDSYSDLTMKLNKLMFDKSIRDVSLDVDLNNKLGSINNTMSSIRQQSNDLFYNSLTDLGLKLYDDYRGVKAKDKLTSVKSTESDSLNKFLYTDEVNNLLNFTFK